MTPERAWRWANVPLPERYLAAIGAGAVLQLVAPLQLPLPRAARLMGASLGVAGVGLAGWAVASAGRASVDRADELVTTGAYEHTRNPMYVGWAVGVLGAALVGRTPWLLLLWAHASRAVHAEVLEEERLLQERFGDRFTAYRARTPRYLIAPRRRGQRMPVS